MISTMIVEQLARFGSANCKPSFFGIPSWYQYLTVDNQCRIINFRVPGDLVLVGLALIDILLHIAGLAAVIFVIYAGIQYTTSQGNPDAAAKAQSSLVNALIGLAISIIAIAFVSFIGRSLA